jgi:hypothetical protein
VKVAVDEGRAQVLRPAMAEHTLSALCGAYTRYLSSRTGLSEETVQDRYFTETGNQPDRDLPRFRRWAGDKVYLLDQLRVDPFSEEAQWG